MSAPVRTTTEQLGIAFVTTLAPDTNLIEKPAALDPTPAFGPMFLEQKLRPAQKALKAVVKETYVHDISAPKVDDFVNSTAAR